MKAKGDLIPCDGGQSLYPMGTVTWKKSITDGNGGYYKNNRTSANTDEFYEVNQECECPPFNTQNT